MTDLDTLMDLDPLQLSARDLDALIAHYRQRRAAPKSRAKKEAGTIDLSGILDGLIKAPAQAGVVRRR